MLNEWGKEESGKGKKKREREKGGRSGKFGPLILPTGVAV
jgi:hypothetical protein